MLFGLIADGNRRWAKNQNLTTKAGHKQGFLVIKNNIIPLLEEDDTFDGCAIYCFSTENWKRSPSEVKYLMQLFYDIMNDWVPELIERKTRVIHAGRKDRIPSFLLKKIQEVEAKTSHFTNFTLYLCLDYGSQDEIVRTFQNLATKPTPEEVNQRLEVPPLDGILRTGGERRLSNFCLWQAAYAELFFLDKFLPDMQKEDIENVIEEFKGRKRRRGK